VSPAELAASYGVSGRTMRRWLARRWRPGQPTPRPGRPRHAGGKAALLDARTQMRCAILRAVRDLGSATAGDAARVAGCGRVQAGAYLRHLRDAGQVHGVTVRGVTIWEVSDAAG
jgi:hypothetical protein